MTATFTPHITAVVDMLNAAALVDPTTSQQVVFGQGVKPDGVGWQGAPGQSPFHPYGIVWRIGSKDSRNLSLDDREATEGRVLVFVRLFGGFPKQADQAADLAHAAVMAHTLTVPGRKVVAIDHDNGSTSTKSETLEQPTWEAGNFYRIWTVPED